MWPEVPTPRILICFRDPPRLGPRHGGALAFPNDPSDAPPWQWPAAAAEKPFPYLLFNDSRGGYGVGESSQCDASWNLFLKPI